MSKIREQFSELTTEYLLQMRARGDDLTDEAHHATTALGAGAAELPAPVKSLMQLTSKVMTGTAYWI